METTLNRGFCFNCGEPVGDMDCDYIGEHTRVWVCSSPECNRELSHEQQAAYDEAQQDAMDDVDARFGRW